MQSLTTRVFVSLLAVSIVALALGTWWVRRAVEAQFGGRMIVEQTVERINGQEVVRRTERALPSGEVVGETISGVDKAQVAELNQRLLLALTVVVLGAGLVTALVARRILGPVRALREAAEGMAAGRLETRVSVGGNDELATLGHAFNTMATALGNQERLKRDLTNDIAHELRTPLTDLRCHLEALQDNVVPVTPEALATLHAEVAHLQRLVEDLGDLARAESRQLQLHPEAVVVAATLDHLARHAAPRAASLGVTLTVDPPKDDVTVWADPARLQQVLSNLIDNALVHTPAGGRVTLSVGGTHAHTVVIEVADTGPGIAAEHLPHVFDRFYRADPSRSRATGGVGLGLAIARQMTEAAGGTISVRSVIGAGTTFAVAWPTESIFTASS
jgi:two-component system sensor histidine kinase BaeS